MKTKKILVSLALPALVLMALSAGPADRSERSAPDPAYLDEGNCTAILVGKDASTDGSTMTTHTCDCGLCDWTWRHVPAADHKPGSKRTIYRIGQYKTWPPSEGLKWDIVKKEPAGLEIPQVPRTYAYHHGMFGYMNEKQLAIGEASIGCQRKMVNNTPTPKFDLTSLTLLAMERCATAREAIQLMGSLAETHGYGFHDDGEMLAVADPKEVWVFEIMPVGPLWTPQSGKPGAVWCAQRVPDDHVSVCPNESRIGEIDLANKDFFMASPNVVSFAVENKFYDPAGGKPFSWKRAYAPVEGSAVSTRGWLSRTWRLLDLAAPSLGLKPETPNMDLPFSVKPDKKVSVQDVMAWTRDKCQGTIFDPVKGIGGGPFKNPNYFRTTRTICDSRAEYTTITQGRGSLPDAVGGLVWIAFGPQDTSCYMPFYAGATELPKSFAVGDHWVLSRDSARWAFEYVDFHVQPVYAEALADVKAVQAKWEGDAAAQVAEVDKQASALVAKSPKKAAALLTGFGLNNAQNVVAAWWKLGDDLLVKYNHFSAYDAPKRSRVRGKPEYGTWWQKAVRAFEILITPDEKK